MSNFDVAVGLDEATLNKALAQLFGQAGVQRVAARGQQKSATPSGDIIIRWEILQPPAISFAPVPADRWKAATKGKHDKVLPEGNVLTLVLPAICLELEYDDGVREKDTTEAHLYATLEVADGKVNVDPKGLWMDQDRIQNLQLSTLISLVHFGLDMAQEALTGIALPALPSDLGVTLGAPGALIHDHKRLILGLAIAPREVDLEGVVWPQEGLFLLGSHDLVNGILRAQLLPRVQGQRFTWRRERLDTPGEGGAAVLEGGLEVLEADVGVNAAELTEVDATARVALRVSAVVSLLKGLGLTSLVRLLEKVYLAWQGLGYGAQLLPSQPQVGVGLVLEDRSVKVQLRHLGRCAPLIWPRGSLPTILLSLALWPLTQLAVVITALVLISRANRDRPLFAVLTVPTVQLSLLDAPLGLTVGGLGCQTCDGRLLIRGDLDLS